MLEAAIVSAPLHDRLAAFRALKSDLAARAVAGASAEAETAFSCGMESLDRALGGGFVRGAIATLEGPPGSGRMSIAARVLAQATRGGLAAAIDDGGLFPPALSRAGVRLDRLLIVPACGALGIARAVDILLRSRSFSVVLMPAIALRAQVWSRLAGLAHKAGAVLIALGVRASAELAAFAVTRIGCVLDRVLVAGASGVFARIVGYDVRAQVLKTRRAAAGASVRLRALERDDGTPVRERVVGAVQLRAVADRAM
jgi:hypothetical protein